MTAHPAVTVTDLIGSVMLPVKTVNESNGQHGHWTTIARNRKKLRRIAHALCPAASLPCVVRMTRHSAGTLDDDGLRSALKSIRDGIADRFGIADNDPRIRFEYEQAACKRGHYGVFIEIRSTQ